MTQATIPRLHKPLIWLLLPVALLAGRPMVGCICSDGTYKISCEKLVGSFLWSRATENQARSCCPNANAGNCPACHEPADTNGESASAQSQCHCRGLANNLQLTVVADPERNRDSTFAAFTNSEMHSSASLIAQGLGSPLRNDFPPPNRVVLFLHLTI